MLGESMVRLAIAKSLLTDHDWPCPRQKILALIRLLARRGARRLDDRIADLMGVAPRVYRFPGND
jgi:hypothetical protein